MKNTYNNCDNISKFDSFCDSVIDSVQLKINDWIGRPMTLHEAFYLNARGYKFLTPIFNRNDYKKTQLRGYLEKFRGQYYHCSGEQELSKLKEVAVEDLWSDTLRNYLTYCFGG